MLVKKTDTMRKAKYMVNFSTFNSCNIKELHVRIERMLGNFNIKQRDAFLPNFTN
jgi:hypothetical protein